MPALPFLRTTTRLLALAAVIAAASLGLTAPAAAQYGGTVDLFVDPTRVEIDGEFDYFGSSCPAGSTVTITIDGFPGVLDTTVAFDDSSYAGTGVQMPAGVVAGQDYTVRASCAGNEASVTIRAVCNDGSDPVDDECPDGGILGEPDPDDPTTSTTIPGGGPGGSGGSGGTGGPGPDLAVTGATFAEQAARIGVTLLALGAILVLLATKRRGEQIA